MRLSVPLIQQPEMSSECGIAAVAMMAEFYKLGLSYSDIKKEIGMYTWGTTTPQLGRFFLAHGFDVEIIGLHPALFSLGNTYDASFDFVHYFQEMRSVLKDGYDALSLEHFIAFVQEGGIVTPRIPTEKDIEKEIHEQRPVLVPLSHWFLHTTEMKPRFSIHFNVVTGEEEGSFTVNDPDFGEDFGGIHLIEKPTLMYAIYVAAKGGIDDACIMCIKKRST